MREELKKQLILDEDKKTCAYPDNRGYLTIGIGRLIDSRVKGAGLREEEIEYLLNNDIDDRISELAEHLPWFATLDDARQGVLVNMAFQLGIEGLLGFKQMLEYVRTGSYQTAAAAMFVSKWAVQTPKRAYRLSKQMRTGLWQYADGGT